MRYATVTKDQLQILQQGLDLLGHVSQDLVPSTLYLYGLVEPDSPVLASVNEATWEDNYAGEYQAESINIHTAAVAIRLSGDILRALLGSGLRSTDDEFMYMLNGEYHTSQFSYTQSKPTLSIGQFSVVALGDDSYWLKDFIQAEGRGQEQQNPSVVERTEPAAGQHGGVGRMPEGHQHQSALRTVMTASQIKSLVEGMFG